MRKTARQRAKEFMAQKSAEYAVHEARYAEDMAEAARQDADKEANVMPCLRPAHPKSYKTWLTGYMQLGNEPTHYYDYPLPTRVYFVARTDFRLGDFFGSSSINVVVPTGIKFLGGNIGHCNLYFLDGFTNRGGWIPMYPDTVPD